MKMEKKEVIVKETEFTLTEEEAKKLYLLLDGFVDSKTTRDLELTRLALQLAETFSFGTNFLKTEILKQRGLPATLDLVRLR